MLLVVGPFGHCLTSLSRNGFLKSIRKHIQSGKPSEGICAGLQALFDGAMENPNIPGLAIILGRLIRFDYLDKSVLHIGWDSTRVTENGVLEHECFMSY